MKIIGLTDVTDDRIGVLAIDDDMKVSEYMFRKGNSGYEFVRDINFPGKLRSISQFADWITAWDPDVFILEEPISINDPEFASVISALPPGMLLAWRGE